MNRPTRAEQRKARNALFGQAITIAFALLMTVAAGRSSSG